jgi:DNA mismatch repair protein MutS2
LTLRKTCTSRSRWPASAAGPSRSWPRTESRRGASPLDDHTLAVLEFPAILDRLAAFTAFSAGRERALAIRPTVDIETVRRRQRETAEAVALHRMGTAVPMGGARDVRPLAAAAARGQMLAPMDLLEIESLCRAAQQAARTLIRVAEDAPLLANLGSGFGDLGPLRVLIDDSIDERGEVRDTASADLAQIRRELGEAHLRLQQRLQSLIASASVRNALQEPIVVMRDGRYVLPVKADFRGSVRGVVHDTSASGATIYIEPLAVVDLANAWRELQVHERHEVERVLRDISTAVGEASFDLIDAVDRLAEIDVSQAKGHLAGALGALDLHVPGPRVPWLAAAPAELRLVEARHPLLHGHVVPTSLHVGGETRALLITGPNTGGKTVAIKTAGLLCLMAMAGLPVPARVGTQIPVFDSIFADIGDEQGAALIATTHHSELKVYAHQTPGVRNASVEFDLKTLRPTYRLTIGLPGQSNALAIAANLGMPSDVIERARAGLSREERDLGALLGDLRAQLTVAEEQAERAARDAATAEAVRIDLERRRAEFVADEARQRQEIRARIARDFRATERALDRARREVEAARIEQARVDVARARELVEAMPAAPEVEPEPLGPGIDLDEIVPGSRIWLRGMDTPGEAIDVPDEDGEIEVQLGSLRTRARLAQITRAEPPPGHRVALGRVTIATPEDTGDTLDLRGQTTDEAMPRVESYLDQVSRTGRARVRLIHGKGTGTLRRAVRDRLDRHPLVTSFETALPAEGGEGVTIVYLQEL